FLCETPFQPARKPAGEQQSLRRYSYLVGLRRNIIDFDRVNAIEPRSIRGNVIKIRQQFAPEGEPGPVEISNADVFVVFGAEQPVRLAEINLGICKLKRVNNQSISRSQEFV